MSIPAESPGVFAPRHRALTLGIVLSITAIAVEGMAVATAMPSAALDLGGLEIYGWAFSSFMLASLVGAISAGQAADRRDMSVPARVGFACFALGLLIGGVAPSWAILLVGRLVQGFGAGCIMALAFVGVARGYPESLRPRLMALLSSAWIVPALVGPALAGQVAEHASWRLVFIGILPPVGVGAWMLLPSLARLTPSAEHLDVSDQPVVAEPLTPSGAHLDVSDYLRSTPRFAASGEGSGRPDPPAGAARLFAAQRGAVSDTPPAAAYLPPRGEGSDDSDALTGAARLFAALRLVAGVALILIAADLQNLALALVIGGAGLVLSAPALRALLPPATFSIAVGLPAAIALRGLLAFGFFGTEALVPLGLSTLRSVPPSLVGLALTAGALSWVVASWIQERAEAASGGSLSWRAVRVIVGLLLIGISIAVAAIGFMSGTLPVEVVAAAWGVSGFGMGLAYPASTLTALAMAPAGQEGAASASLQVAETIGIATGTGATGALVGLAVHVQHPMSDGLLWGFMVAVAAIVLALAPAFRLTPALRLGLSRYRALGAGPLP